MSLVSLKYLLFVFIALIAFYIVPKKYQWTVLLVFSIVFYVLVGVYWTIVYLILGIISTWFVSNKIFKINNDENLAEEIKNKKAKLWLIIGLIIDVGLLALLKYTNFLLSNFSRVYNLFATNKISLKVNWVASLGISFYTLQIVGYLIDCYWGICSPQKNIFKFALFSCFFSQMVSGPISKYNDLGEKLYSEHEFKFSNIYSGIVRIIVGFCKKVLVATNFSILASRLLDQSTGIFAFLGMLCYVVEIYADFSGCMDIVVGTAKCFDIEMVENFKSPFRSRNTQEFWRNWHITLGAWLRDYIMYPILRTKTWNKLTKTTKNKLGKRASKLIPTHIAMLILWFFMGLWHGGGWNFILEGVWFWLVIVIGEWISPFTKKLTSKFEENYFWILFQRIRTILIYAIGALMFRANSIRDFFCVFKNIFFTGTTSIGSLEEVGLLISTPIIAFIVFSLLNYFSFKNNGLENRIKGRPVMWQVLVLFFIVYITVLFGNYGDAYNAADFIYGGF